MTEIVILDHIFNGFRIEYSNNIYKYDTITKYIQDELLEMLKSNNLYNLIPAVYDLKFIIYKTRDSDKIIYAESINEYTDYKKKCIELQDEITDLKKIIEIKNKSIEYLERKVNNNVNNSIENLIQENKDFRNSLYCSYTKNNQLLKDKKRLEDENKRLKECIKDLEEQVIQEKHKYNYLF